MAGRFCSGCGRYRLAVFFGKNAAGQQRCMRCLREGDSWAGKRGRGKRAAVTLSPVRNPKEFAAATPPSSNVVHLPLADRPRTRGDCVGAERPCPWAGCRHHLLLDVTSADSIRLAHGHDDPSLLAETCSLDVADRGEHKLEAVGAVLGVTRERVRQLEVAGKLSIRRRVRRNPHLYPELREGA